MEAITTPQTEMQVKDWLVTFLVLSIPLVNIIMLFVWGFGEGNRTRATFCKSALIWFLIIAALYTVFFLVFGVGAFMLGNF